MHFCFQEGRRGYLEGLANHYSKHVTAKYEDILNAIENVRISKWTERHVRAVNAITGPGPVSTTMTMNTASTMKPHKSVTIVNQSLLPNSHSQTIYVPGKYLVSFPCILSWYRWSRVDLIMRFSHFKSFSNFYYKRYIYINHCPKYFCIVPYNLSKSS